MPHQPSSCPVVDSIESRELCIPPPRRRADGPRCVVRGRQQPCPYSYVQSGSRRRHDIRLRSVQIFFTTRLRLPAPSRPRTSASGSYHNISTTSTALMRIVIFVYDSAQVVGLVCTMHTYTVGRYTTVCCARPRTGREDETRDVFDEYRWPREPALADDYQLSRLPSPTVSMCSSFLEASFSAAERTKAAAASCSVRQQRNEACLCIINC